MRRYLIIALILTNIILMGAIVYIAPMTVKTAKTVIMLSELAQADHRKINDLETNVRFYTDPEIAQIRTIDYILRRGEFTDRP